MVILPKYSMGIGDRFGRQAVAQLSAIQQAQQRGIDVAPVWNKSYREHQLIGTHPASVRQSADAAVAQLGYGGAYFVDADHIHLKNVQNFIDFCDFFTIDVADYIGKPCSQADLDHFCRAHRSLVGRIEIAGLSEPVVIDAPQIARVGQKFLYAIQQAAQIYQFIEQRKGKERFVAEVSMDETDAPQTPVELLLILAGLAQYGVPAQTIAPRFVGRFNKGVDYVGNVDEFARQFRQCAAVVRDAAKRFGFPENLKLSVHSGSDKFSIYPAIRQTIKEFNVGLHLKTAGTTWLEEVIGLAESGGEGLAIAKEIYATAIQRVDELCAPYATVIDIDPRQLPSAEQVKRWSGQEFAAALRHEPSEKRFNPHLRQLLHVGYKIAAQMGQRYLDALDACKATVSKNVSYNILQRHLIAVFG